MLFIQKAGIIRPIESGRKSRMPTSSRSLRNNQQVTNGNSSNRTGNGVSTRLNDGRRTGTKLDDMNLGADREVDRTDSRTTQWKGDGDSRSVVRGDNGILVECGDGNRNGGGRTEAGGMYGSNGHDLLFLHYKYTSQGLGRRTDCPGGFSGIQNLAICKVSVAAVGFEPTIASL